MSEPSAIDGTVFPVTSAALRRALAAKSNICPECGSELDTGWECNNHDCQYDAQQEATSCTNADVIVWLEWKHPFPPDNFGPNRF